MNIPVNFVGRIKGLNLTTKPGAPKLSQLWIEWDWNGWIRPQIDCAVALGCNSVRLVGDVMAVLGGGISQGTYDQRLQQAVSYCQQNGLAYYYTGVVTYDTNGADNGAMSAYAANPTAFINVVTSNLNALANYWPTIIGCDLIGEANAWNNASVCQAFYSACRPLVPNQVGCTFSTFGKLTDVAWMNQIVAYCDYLDYHIYPMVYGISGEPVSLAPVYSSYPGKDVLIGEAGANINQNTTVQVEQWINGVVILGSDTNVNCRGAMIWAIQDQDQQYGAFDAGWHPRPCIAGPWLKWCRLSYLPSVPTQSVPPLSSLTDGQGNVWSLGTATQYGFQILRNGSWSLAANGQATLIVYSSGKIKTQNNLGDWWLWLGANPWWQKTTPP